MIGRQLMSVQIPSDSVALRHFSNASLLGLLQCPAICSLTWLKFVHAWPAQPLTVHVTTVMLSLSSALQFAESIGLPTEEGIFGFKPFAEVGCGLLPLLWHRGTRCCCLCCAPSWQVSLSRALRMQVWVGRLAMAGFLSAIIGEFITGGRHSEIWPAALLSWPTPPKSRTQQKARPPAWTGHTTLLLPSVWPCTCRALTCAACHALTWLHMCAGKGPLGQIGLITPSPPLLVTLAAALTSATFVALAQTLIKAQKGDLSPRCGASHAQIAVQAAYRHAKLVVTAAAGGVRWRVRRHLHHVGASNTQAAMGHHS